MRDRRIKREPTAVGQVIGSVLRNLGLPEDTARQGMIMIAWDQIAGDASGHARPVRFRGKSMIVEVSDPSWMNELSMRKNEIIKKLDDLAGKGVVTDIRFTLMRGRWTEEK